MSVQQIIRLIGRMRPIRRICLTGGEPLLQEGIYPLMQALLQKKYQVSLETSGTLDISRVPRAVVKVMDIKTPGAGVQISPSPLEGEGARRAGEGEIVNPFDNLKHLFPHDEVKFVVTNKRDIDWSLRLIKKHGINKICHVSLSPVGVVGAASVRQRKNQTIFAARRRLLPGTTARAILKSGLDNVRLQVQLHKIIGLR